MVRAPLNPPGSPKVPAWKERHSGVVCMLSTGMKADGRLSHELIQAVKLKYGYKSDKAVRQIWKKHKQAVLNGDPIVIHRKKGSGRKHKFTGDGLSERIRGVPRPQRKTLRSLSHVSGIPKSTLHDYVRRGLLQRTTSSIKPSLTPANLQKRVDYCMSHVEPDGRFNDLKQIIHVDEKWFFVAEIDKKCYLLPDEDPEYRTCKHKSHIDKVMFGAAVARPSWDPHTRQWWDGKIHIMPFIQYVRAPLHPKNSLEHSLEGV